VEKTAKPRLVDEFGDDEFTNLFFLVETYGDDVRGSQNSFLESPHINQETSG
jgi:hypothetical protein